MKLSFALLAVSLLSFIESKSCKDHTRKCIVKYLSDKQLLDSSFVVDSVLPDNCYELIDNKVQDIYEASYYKDNADDEAKSKIIETLKSTDMVDLVLKSDLIGDTKRAEELLNIFQELKKIEEFVRLWPDSANGSFSFTSSNIDFSSYCFNDVFRKTLTKYFGNEDCEKILSFRKTFDDELLEIVTKISSEEAQNCIRKTYKQFNIAHHFLMSYIDNLTQGGAKQISQFKLTLNECVRLSMKESSNITFMIELDFNRALNIYLEADESKIYRKTEEIIVKLNQENNHTDIFLIANETSEFMKYSKCYVEELYRIDFKAIAFKMMSLEEDFEILELLKLQQSLQEYFQHFVSFCDGSFFVNYTLRNDQLDKNSFMKCFGQFVTEEEVEGVTFFRVNIAIQPDDLKCSLYYELAQYRYSDRICAVKEMEMMDFYRLSWTIRIMKQFKISTQQQKELENDVMKFERGFKDITYTCMFEMLEIIQLCI